MPCHRPLQAFYSIRSNGKKDLDFSMRSLSVSHKLFKYGIKSDGVQATPCGKCMGCRLEKSRQWAIRCSHEASLYQENCFVTLTFDEEHLKKMCPTGSLSKKHMKDFMKRLKQFDARDREELGLSKRTVRQFYCGEYGETCRDCGLSRKFCKCEKFVKALGRPHYHLCLFNFDFPDKKFFMRCGREKLYTSDILRKLWPYGNHSIGSVTFQSAAYIARYQTKKINGEMAEEHYKKISLETGEVFQVISEFAEPSRKPGLGRGWIDKFGETDVFPFDEVVIDRKGNKFKSKPPRYYDTVLEQKDPLRFKEMKEKRIQKAKEKADDNTYDRLAVKEKCFEARIKNLVRTLEDGD